ncbi:MAG: cation transporter, partial [Spiroplasma sp.]|nr:cation transporter [Mycoplasmatales bacterium]
MRKKKNEFEKKASNYNLIPIFFMAVSGIIGGILSNSSAIFIDGAFSAVLFFTIFLGKWIQLQIIKPKNNDYPVGRSRLGSLYVLFKILILIGILSYSFIDSGFIIIKYAGGNYTPELVDVYYARIYYVVKTIAFIISFALYTYYLKQTNYQSTILRVDRKGTVIDGGITLGIMSGFFFLGKIPLVAPISDSIILLF